MVIFVVDVWTGWRWLEGRGEIKKQQGIFHPRDQRKDVLKFDCVTCWQKCRETAFLHFSYNLGWPFWSGNLKTSSETGNVHTPTVYF